VSTGRRRLRDPRERAARFRAGSLGVPGLDRPVRAWPFGSAWGLFLGLACIGTLACEDPSEPASVLSEWVWPSGDLVAVALPESEHAIVLSAQGAVYLTRDLGQTWQRARLPAVESLSALSMVDPRLGWAVGTGVILRTEDGGARWERQRLPGRPAEHRLHSVATLDADRAIALGEAGRLLRSFDGGGVWQEAPGPAAMGAEALACGSAAEGHCWLVGVGVQKSLQLGAERHRVPVEDAVGLSNLEFRVGGVEALSGDRRSLSERVSRFAHAPVQWTVDPGVSAEELARFAEDQDPSALFDLIEARASEVVGLLEAAGIPSEAIAIEGRPPWGYEDHLDDDPGLLERYWQSRLRPKPGAAIGAAFDLALYALALGEGGAWTVGRGGMVLAPAPVGGGLRRFDSPSSHDLLGVALSRNIALVVGRQGGLFRGVFSGDGVEWDLPKIEPSRPFFETLRGVAFDPSGASAMAVGEAGRILASADGGLSWRWLTPPTQEHRALVR